MSESQRSYARLKEANEALMAQNEHLQRIVDSFGVKAVDELLAENPTIEIPTDEEFWGRYGVQYNPSVTGER